VNLRKLAIVFAIALSVSGLCTVSLGRRLAVAAARHKVSRHYVVPVRALNPNEVLKADSLTVIDWPSEVEVPGAFIKPADLVGRTVLYPIDKGQPITDKLVSAPGAGTGLAGRIPQGMRAIALRTDEVIGVAGFLVPGSRLDVLATYRPDRSPEPITVTVLQNAEVLAAGHQVEPDPDGKPAPVTVVTLLLTPEDAEKVVLASSQGTIHFIMRSGSDEKLANDEPVLLSSLAPEETTVATGRAPTASRPLAAPRPTHRHTATHPAPKLYMVETIVGEKETTRTFQVDGR
jgi:pilus assembly protein CpaB